MPSETNVRVVCRFRPVNKRETIEAENKSINKKQALCCSAMVDIGSISVKLKNAPSLNFVVDDVIWTNCDQEETYRIACEPVISDVLRGYNGTVFAYGQTGSGMNYQSINVYAWYIQYILT